MDGWVVDAEFLQVGNLVLCPLTRRMLERMVTALPHSHGRETVWALGVAAEDNWTVVRMGRPKQYIDTGHTNLLTRRDNNRACHHRVHDFLGQEMLDVGRNVDLAAASNEVGWNAGLVQDFGKLVATGDGPKTIDIDGARCRWRIGIQMAKCVVPVEEGAEFEVRALAAGPEPDTITPCSGNQETVEVVLECSYDRFAGG